MFFILYAFYLMSWNWGFLPVTEGFFLIAGKAINAGEMPYEDFYAYLPPAYYWLSALLTYFDDLGVQAGRVFGYAIMLLFYPILYNLYKRWFDKIFDLNIFTFFSLIILTSSTAFLSYDFTQLVILFSLTGWLLLTFDTKKYLFLSGSALAIATLIKQSNGAAVTLIALLFVLFRYKNDLEKILSFIFGGLITSILIFLPVFLYSDIEVAVSSIFIEAANNKGGGINSLYNWFTKGFYSLENLKIFSLITLEIGIFISFNYIVLRFINLSESRKYYIYFIISSFILLTIYKYNYDIEIIKKITDILFWKNIFLISGYIGFLVVILYCFSSKNFVDANQGINLSGGLLNISLILGSGMSGGLTKTSIFFSISFVILLIIQISKNNIFVRYFLIVLCLLVSFDIIKNKYDEPYKWWGYDSKSSKIFNFNIKNLESFKELNHLNVYFESCKIKPKNLLPFPHMTMFNIITNTRFFGKSTVLWFDFLSDNHANEVLLEIEKNLPDSFILWHPPKNAFEAHSNLFKSGRKLIHLDIYELLKSKNFRSEYNKKIKFKISSTEFELYFHKKLNCEEK